MNVVDMIDDVEKVSEKAGIDIGETLSVVKEWERLKGAKACSMPAPDLTPIKVPKLEPNPYQAGVRAGMMYFEFNRHEYWALIAAGTVDKAYEIYAENVANSDAEEVRKEGQASPVSTRHALDKYIKSRMTEKLLNKGFTEEFTKDFFERYNTVVLIESSLV